jgi:hypothetical protein
MHDIRLSSVAVLFLTFAGTTVLAQGFSTRTEPSVTPAKVAGMECRYFTELLGIHSEEGIRRQFDPIANTEIDTVVCCPMAWRFYNYPSKVDLTWKEPDKHRRDVQLFPNWKKMVDNLAAGGDPLRDALQAARRLKKRFVVSFRMNDSHYVSNGQFPTHNNFWRDHPEYRLGNDAGASSPSVPANVLNYMVPEVRDFYFSVLEEICTSYDVDGVELDFQRAPRFFHAGEIERGRAAMTAHVRRIRTMLDNVSQSRGRRLEFCVRVLPTVKANEEIGLDVMAWEAAGWLDGMTVSSSYIHSADVGIEEFAARRKRARIFGELNYVHLQLPGTGHDAQDRRYVNPEAYRAATLSYMERGADGVSFFNTYCVPQPALGKLMADLLGRYKDLDLLKHSDKNYTCYATPNTMFGVVFPARNEKTFEVFIADAIPGLCRRSILRLETKASSRAIRIEATVNDVRLEECSPDTVELFPLLLINRSAPKPENLKYFAVPLSALRFGINTVSIKNPNGREQPCTFAAAELALYMTRTSADQKRH